MGPRWAESGARAARWLRRRFKAKLRNRSSSYVRDPATLTSSAEDLRLFTAIPVEQFPAWETAGAEHAVDDQIHGDRLRMLKSLSSDPSDRPRLIVTSIQSLLQPVPSPKVLAAQTRRLCIGDVVDVDELLRWIAANGFQDTPAVQLPGEFSVRGGIVDVFAPDWDEPVRIELFGDQVESIRRFEVSSQRSLKPLDALEITILKPSAEHRDHLTSYLPPRSWFLLVEPDEMQEEAQHYLRRVDRPQDFHTAGDVLKEVYRFPSVTAAAVSAGSLEATCQLRIESVERFSGDIAKVRDELDTAGVGQEVVIVCQTEAEIERLREIFGGTQLAAQGKLGFVVGRLQAGFRLVARRLVLVSGNELFHRSELNRPSQRRLSRVVDSFLDLREGDYIVHLAHGIGRYRGLKLLEKDDQVEEHLELEFHGGTKIYVPAANIELVQKYVGGSKSRPSLAHIGGKQWVKQKEAAREAVTDLAADMLRMQAMRSSRPGIRFPGRYAVAAGIRRGLSLSRNDRPAQRHRGDQARHAAHAPDGSAALRRRRLRQDRGRDAGGLQGGRGRLSGRRARADDDPLRAASPDVHRANGRVSFSDRRLEPLLHRQGAIADYQGLEGRLDRHRDRHASARSGRRRVRQSRAGDHRRGAAIRRRGEGAAEGAAADGRRADDDGHADPADAAHVALGAARHLESRNAPEDRLAVETRVTRFDEELIRHAVLRELNRSGQIFFVHNRINDIGLVAAKLQRIVPEARIRIGHGQMPEGELEEVMLDFVGHKFDMLLATTIVESGLDIPNANTIFIDEADRYGLADLHQFRGRVGRYKHRAYCYLLLDPNKYISGNSVRRLRAIEEFSDMGAGFAIAMRDLEIRGAGNILGTQQSGHIAVVGYELYCELLEQAVRRLQHMPPKQVLDVHVDLPGEAFIPPTYVPDMRLKIDLYRRLARVAVADELADLSAEMIDRFGAWPAAVGRLVEQAELRIAAADWQIDAIRREEGFVVFDYRNRGRIEELAKLKPGRLRIVDGRSAYLPLEKGVADFERLAAAIKSVLQPE